MNNQYTLMTLISISAIGIWFYDTQLYANIFRFMPFMLGVYWFIQKQYIALKYCILVMIIILGLTFGIKLGFAYIATHYNHLEYLQEIISIAQRPINGEFKGFPSGHSTAAFIAAMLAWYFINKQWGIFIFILALFVGYSRIINLWHTYIQVFSGAILGFIGSYIVIYLLSKIDKQCKKDYNLSP